MTETINLGTTTNKKLVLVFAALFAITLVGLNIAVASYFSEVNSKNHQINQLNDQINSIQERISNLTLISPAPYLINVGLNYFDNRTNSSAPFLQVTGYVVNVGTAKATGCTIHMYAIQNGNTTAIDTSAAIRSLDAGAYTQISFQFTYTGQPLTAFSSSLDWEK